jgi:DNA repair protein RecO (recombination protein O)
LIHSTRAIVLRAIKYGETSLILTLYTELFGVQSCLVQGVRKSTKHSAGKGGYFASGSILQITLYHSNQQNLQRIKDFQFDTLHPSIHSNVVKNAIVVLMMEVLQQTIQEPEPNAELFLFVEETLQHIEQHDAADLTWLPHYFCVQYFAWIGFGFQGEYSIDTPFLHLQKGDFVPYGMHHVGCSNGSVSKIIFTLSQTALADVGNLQLDTSVKKQVLHDAIAYLQIHVPSMQRLKSLEVLEVVFG